MMKATEERRPKRLRRLGLILGLIGAVLAVAASFFSCVINFQSPTSIEIGVWTYSWILHWVIIIAESVWPFIGGILAILDALGLATFIFLQLRSPDLDVPQVSILFLPTVALLLASGILFIVSSKYATRKIEED